jgi:hypothetical protein
MIFGKMTQKSNDIDYHRLIKKNKFKYCIKINIYIINFINFFPLL